MDEIRRDLADRPEGTVEVPVGKGLVTIIDASTAVSHAATNTLSFKKFPAGKRMRIAQADRT